MADYLIEIVFDGLDLDDSEQIDALAYTDLVTAEPVDEDRWRLAAIVTADNPVVAALRFSEAVLRLVPSATAISVDRDLVSVSDIADRVGLTREAVRNWASGKRRAGQFPTPVGMPSGIKVWEWSAVHAWLRRNLGVWDDLEMPTHDDYAVIESHLLQRPSVKTQISYTPTVVVGTDAAAARSVRVREHRFGAGASDAEWSQRSFGPRETELVA